MSSKKKKTYAAVLAIGFLILVADRLLAPEPSRAAAKSKRMPATTRLAADATTSRGGGPAASVTTAAFPRALPGADPQNSLRDAFGLTPAALQLLGGPASGTAELKASDQGQRPPDPGMTAARFIQLHRLTAVIQGPSASVAVLDDRWVQVGDTVDQCTLVGITGRSASFECPDGPADLSIEISGSGSPR